MAEPWRETGAIGPLRHGRSTEAGREPRARLAAAAITSEYAVLPDGTPESVELATDPAPTGGRVKYRPHIRVVGTPRRHVPSNEERAAWFRGTGTTVAQQVHASLVPSMAERLFVAGCDAVAVCFLGLQAARRALARARRALKGAS